MYEIDFDKFKDIFFAEAKEHLDSADAALGILGTDPGNVSAIFELFRAAHTLKSMAATMGFDKITPLVQEMSKGLDKLNKSKTVMIPEILVVISECFEGVKALVDEVATGTDRGISIDALIGKMRAVSEIRQGNQEAALVKDMFFSELADYLNSVNELLERLAENPGNRDAIFELFRIVLTIKSMAATVGYDAIGRFASSLAAVLDEFREGRQVATVDNIMFIAGCFDILRVLRDEAYTGINRNVNIEAPTRELDTFFSRNS
jgi:two-component system chemotaxis sensor kinase CheA